METVNCNLCGSAKLKFVYSMPDRHFFPNERFNVVECKGCGLGFVNPRPSFEEINRYYPPEFYEYFTTDLAFHKKRYQEESKYLLDVKKGKDRPRLLDIGCANGDFARYMATQGWEVEGVEISANSQPIHDFPVYRIPFDQLEGKRAQYDAVTAWAVLEHVHNPMAYFRKASEVLKSDGIFVFLVTNFKSLSSKRLFGEDVPRHLYFFTRDTIQRYMEIIGMELIAEDYRNNIYGMAPRGWLYYLITRLVKRRDFTWEDMPPSFSQYLNRNKLEKNISSMFRYALTHPIDILDRALVPLLERYQIWTKTYGIVTYTARKR